MLSIIGVATVVVLVLAAFSKRRRLRLLLLLLFLLMRHMHCRCDDPAKSPDTGIEPEAPLDGGPGELHDSAPVTPNSVVCPPDVPNCGTVPR